MLLYIKHLEVSDLAVININSNILMLLLGPQETGRTSKL